MRLRQRFAMAALHGAMALFAAALTGSCSDWDDGCYAYDCVRVYYPYYGYYLDCYPVRVSCGSDEVGAQGGPRRAPQARACKLDGDCSPGQFCDQTGYCSRHSDAARPDAGPLQVDAASASYVDAASIDASDSDAGASSSSVASGSNTDAGDSAATNGGGSPSSSSPEAGASGSTTTPGASHGERRIRRFNMPCQRDSQCGPGACTKGECFQACTTDEQCGTADRCAVETGRRVCMHDPNPQVRCEVSADCAVGYSCVDGACHPPCDVDTDCADPQDRCMYKLCFPDRRPTTECVLNLECAEGSMCLDGRCVNLSEP